MKKCTRQPARHGSAMPRQAATPDHTHAVITAAAMKRAKYVYTQMPLAHDAWEIRLSPVSERSYHPSYHPYNWRGWRDFGTGALGAMGCHVMDGAFWALKLADATIFTIEADSTGLTGDC